MAVLRSTGRADFTFEAGDMQDDVLHVLRFRGSEGVSELFRYDLDLVSDESDIDFDKVVGQPAKLVLKLADGERFISGIVSRFEFTGRKEKHNLYTAQVVPRLWTLSLHRQSRIFQNMKTPDILKQVLEDAKFTTKEFKFSTFKRAFKPRTFCVQYRESDLDFMSRLMEEDGIFYYFEHTEDGHVLVMADDSTAKNSIEGTAEVPFRLGESGMVAEDEVRQFKYARSVRVGAVVVKEYDFKKPDLDLKAEKKADLEKDIEWYDYPGAYHEPGTASEVARVRLEELRASKTLGSGESNVRRFVSGYQFKLAEHDRDDLNQEWLILRVMHWGEQPQAAKEFAATPAQALPTYQNEFECIPAAMPFRPPRITPMPRVEGPQTAVVTGPSGEEIHTDEFGRVKVQFHWDRKRPNDDTSSCWIRVSQGWGGTAFGAMYIPRIGEEVIVEFLEGDPNRPLITGRVYNGNNPTPYSLPDDKTKSTIKSNSSPGGGGSNELRFEDAAGKEQVYMHSQKNMDTEVENDQTLWVGNDQTHKIDRDQVLLVKQDRKKEIERHQQEIVGGDKSILVKGKHVEQIDKTKGVQVGQDHNESIGGNMSVIVGSSMSETVATNHSHLVGAAYELTVGGLASIAAGAAVSISAGAALAEMAGGSKSENIGGDRGITTGGDATHTIGGTLTDKVSKDVSVEHGAKSSLKVADALTINAKKIQFVADDEVQIKSGSATIVLKKNGDITIEGKAINVKGSGDIVLKGSSIKGN